jgi:hypothetical protein
MKSKTSSPTYFKEGKMSKSSFNFCISIFLIVFLISPIIGQTRFGKVGAGIEFSTQYVLGAGSVIASPGLGGGINMSVSLLEGLSFRSKFVVNQLAWKTENKDITTDLMSIGGCLSGDLMPNSNFNLFPFVSLGFVFYDPKDETSGGRPQYVTTYDVQFGYGVGCDYFVNEYWSITLMPEYVMTGSRYFNGPANPGNDSYLRISLQARYYFFDQSFITKLLETLRARTKQK